MKEKASWNREARSDDLLFQLVKFRGGENASKGISNPSQSFLIVTVPGFRLFPLRMLLIVACGTADRLLSPLGVMPRSLHIS